MSQWITDRRPTEDDGPMVYGPDGKVCHYKSISDPWKPWIRRGPWKPIPPCEPYVAQPRFTVVWYDNVQTWGVKDSQDDERGLQSNFESKQAAERIAEAYNEVLYTAPDAYADYCDQLRAEVDRLTKLCSKYERIHNALQEAGVIS